MKISNKTKKGLSIAAAIILLGTLFFGLLTNVIMWGGLYTLNDITPTGATIVHLLINAVTTVLVVIALFRGKKDVLAAIFFLITAAALMVTGVISGIVSIITLSGASGFGDDPVISSMIAGNWVAVFATLVSIGFRVLLALECFKPGKISGSGMKALLIVLPMSNILLTVVADMVRQRYLVEDYGFAEFFLAAGFPAILSAVTSIGWILAGAAFAKPVYEKEPAEDICGE